MPTLVEMRKDCGYWDEEMGCLNDYDEECPIHGACEKEAMDPELSDEEKVPA